MLGTLAHHDGAKLDSQSAPELERLMLHRLAVLDGTIRAAYAAYDYKRVVAAADALPATPISRPSISTSAKTRSTASRPRARSARPRSPTIEQIFRCVAAWLAPILPFTAEEAWLARYPSDTGSVHLEVYSA